MYFTSLLHVFFFKIRFLKDHGENLKKLEIERVKQSYTGKICLIIVMFVFGSIVAFKTKKSWAVSKIPVKAPFGR